MKLRFPIFGAQLLITKFSLKCSAGSHNLLWIVSKYWKVLNTTLDMLWTFQNKFQKLACTASSRWTPREHTVGFKPVAARKEVEDKMKMVNNFLKIARKKIHKFYWDPASRVGWISAEPLGDPDQWQPHLLRHYHAISSSPALLRCHNALKATFGIFGAVIPHWTEIWIFILSGQLVFMGIWFSSYAAAV